MRSFWTLSALLLVFPFLGCAQEQTPDEAMKVMATSLSENKPQVAWEGLPPSYQKDVDGLVHEFAGKMDPDIWDGGFDIAKKVVRILDEKREFILANELLAKTGMDVEVAKENWDGVVKALSTVVDSELSDLEELKTLKVESFLAGTGSEFMEQMSALAEVSKQEEFKNEMADYKAAQFKLIKSEGDTGTIEVSIPNQETETVEMVKVEGKWIPKELADQWATKMQEARDGLAKIPVEEMKQKKEQVLAQMKMIDTQLTLLLDSKSADEFNGKVGAMAMMLSMGAGFGGGAGPGPMPGPGPGGFEFTPDDSGPTPDNLPEDSTLPGEPSSDATPSDLNAPAATVPTETVPSEE